MVRLVELLVVVLVAVVGSANATSLRGAHPGNDVEFMEEYHKMKGFDESIWLEGVPAAAEN